MPDAMDGGDDPAQLFSMVCEFYRLALVDSGYAASCPIGAVAQEAARGERPAAVSAPLLAFPSTKVWLRPAPTIVTGSVSTKNVDVFGYVPGPSLMTSIVPSFVAFDFVAASAMLVVATPA